MLDENPLEDVAHTQKIAGVVLRGRWLDARSLGEIEAKLIAIYDRFGAGSGAPSADDRAIDRIVNEHVKMSKDGFVFRDHDLERMASMLADLGRADDASKLRALKTDPTFRFP